MVYLRFSLKLNVFENCFLQMNFKSVNVYETELDKISGTFAKAI